MRQYESLLLQLESASLDENLASNNALSVYIARTSHMLRAVIRLLSGEQPEPEPPAIASSSTSTFSFEENNMRVTDGGTVSSSSILRVHPHVSEALDPSEWALERECELARLEKENEELRWLLKASEEDAQELPRSIPRLMLPPTRNAFSNSRRGIGRGRGFRGMNALDMQHVPTHEALQGFHDISDEMGHKS